MTTTQKIIQADISTTRALVESLNHRPAAAHFYLNQASAWLTDAINDIQCADQNLQNLLHIDAGDALTPDPEERQYTYCPLPALNRN